MPRITIERRLDKALERLAPEYLKGPRCVAKRVNLVLQEYVAREREREAREKAKAESESAG